MTSPHSGPGTRRAAHSPLRRASTIVLVIGTILALAAAFGPTVLVRLGVVVAIASAITVAVLAGREIVAERRRHARQSLQTSRAHGTAMTQLRTRNAEVVEALTGHLHTAGAELDRQRTAIGELRQQVSGLHGERVHLQAEVAQRDTTISSLRDTVRAQERELVARSDEVDGDLHHLPRRLLADSESAWDDLPAADDLWSDGGHPTVVDLQMIDLAMVKPNYEQDRKLA